MILKYLKHQVSTSLGFFFSFLINAPSGCCRCLQLILWDTNVICNYRSYIARDTLNRRECVVWDGTLIGCSTRKRCGYMTNNNFHLQRSNTPIGPEHIFEENFFFSCHVFILTLIFENTVPSFLMQYVTATNPLNIQLFILNWWVPQIFLNWRRNQSKSQNLNDRIKRKPDMYQSVIFFKTQNIISHA